VKTVKVVSGMREVEVTIRKHHWAKRVNLKVTSDGRVSITLPKRSPYRLGEQFANQQKEWILRHATVENQIQTLKSPTTKQRAYARRVITSKVEHWGKVMGVEFERIAIRNQRTRWGSCSSKGNLNFNWRLAGLNEELQDYVVVHELAHLKHLNHSPNFYSLVEQYLPDHKTMQKKLAQQSIGAIQ